jgi:hypothetical protein
MNRPIVTGLLIGLLLAVAIIAHIEAGGITESAVVSITLCQCQIK